MAGLLRPLSVQALGYLRVPGYRYVAMQQTKVFRRPRDQHLHCRRSRVGFPVHSIIAAGYVRLSQRYLIAVRRGCGVRGAGFWWRTGCRQVGLGAGTTLSTHTTVIGRVEVSSSRGNACAVRVKGSAQ